MTITTSPGCSWSPSTQSQSGPFSCMISASMNSSGCTATLTNESFQTYCDDSNQCYFEINNINETLICDGSSWTTTTAIGNQSVTGSGSCTCQALGAAVNPSTSTTSTTGSSTQATPSSGSSTPTSVSSTLVRTSTALLMVYVVAFSIVGNI
ncbi:hypothetical protein VKS41_008901 [Umbelopsis sp. WA50703]|jgi:hypothetical protein